MDMEPFFSWRDSHGKVHGAESGNLTFALCGVPLEALISELKVSRWKAENAPADLCEDCRQKVAERSSPTSDERDGDTASDPARSDAVGNDWTSEGGATPEGPATDTELSPQGRRDPASGRR